MISEFPRAKSAVLEKINLEVNWPPAGHTFAAPATPGPREPLIKCVARDDLLPAILHEGATMEYFTLWKGESMNWFKETYMTKGTYSQFYHSLLRRVDKIWKDRLLTDLQENAPCVFNLDVIEKL